MTPEPEPDAGREGVTHSGPETLNITGKAIGGPARPGSGARAESARTTDPVLRNEGVLNLGPGQIIMDNCITGPGATIHVSRDDPEPEAEL